MSHIITLIDRFDSKQRAKYIVNMIEYCILPPHGEEITDEHKKRIGKRVNEYGDEKLIEIWKNINHILEMSYMEKVRIITEMNSHLYYLESKESAEECKPKRIKIRLNFDDL